MTKTHILQRFQFTSTPRLMIQHLRIQINSSSSTNLITLLSLKRQTTLFIRRMIHSLKQELRRRLTNILLRHLLLSRTRSQRQRQFSTTSITITITTQTPSIHQLNRQKPRTLPQRLRRTRTQSTTRLRTHTIRLSHITRLFLSLTLITQTFRISRISRSRTTRITSTRLTHSLSNNLRIHIRHNNLSITTLNNTHQISISQNRHLNQVSRSQTAKKRTRNTIRNILSLKLSLRTKRRQSLLLMRLRLTRIHQRRLLRRLTHFLISLLIISRSLTSIKPRVIARHTSSRPQLLMSRR